MPEPTVPRTTGRPACPICGLPGTPLAFGYPAPEMFDAADRGEVVLGGCVIGGEMPTHECPAGHQWLDDDTDDVEPG